MKTFLNPELFSDFIISFVYDKCRGVHI